MAKIEIYTSPICGYCHRAKALLNRKGVSFTEIDIAGNAEKRGEMVMRSKGRQTVPQIFINGQHVGGCDDIHALDSAGKLDPLLTVS